MLVVTVLATAVVACASSEVPSAVQVTPRTAAEPAASPPITALLSRTPLPQPASAAPLRSTPRPAVASGARVIAEVAPRPVGVLTDVDTEVELLTPLPSADLIRDIAARLRGVPGIIELRGDEHSITVIYDTAQITPTRIHEAFAQLGYPVKGGTEVMDPGIAAD